MRHRISKPLLGVLCAFFVAFCGVSAWAEDRNVLILNSYHQGFQWTDSITETIIQEMQSDSINISVEYMDTKRVKPNRRYYELLASIYREKFSENRFDLIITTDDNAANFASRYHESIFNLAPIVFVGVNNQDFPTLVDRDYITGVLEISSERELLELAQRLHPEAKEVLAIYDRTLTGEYQWNLFKQQSKAFPNFKFTRVSGDETILELEQRLAGLGEETIVILGAYYRDSSGRFISLEEGTKRISDASARPVYTLYQQVFDHGTLGGFLLSGATHGEKAAELGQQILFGFSPAEIPVIERGLSKPVFHYDHLARFDMLDAPLPENAVILGAPNSFLRVGRWVVVVVSCAIFFLIVAISTLVAIIRRKNTHHKELERLHEQISRVAVTDHLTQIYNRYAFDRWSAERPAGGPEDFLILIDIDNMKLVNDHYGHLAGDKVLIAVSERIRAHGEAYRIGGDEFALLVSAPEDEVHAIAERLIEQIAEPVRVGPDLNTIVSASIGVANLLNREAKASDLLKLADLALNKSKQEGKNRISTYQPSLHRDIADLVEASEQVSELTIEGGSPTFFFQPIIDLPTGEVAGYEMLLRCFSIDGRALPVPTVISAFENIGKSQFLTMKTFRAAADFCSYVVDGFVAINLNKSQLMTIDKNSLDAIITETNLDPRTIVIEVNESEELFNAEILRIMKMLRAAGFRIALDDFGTGYSTLASIEYLPLDIVKLDKLFVAPARKSDTTLRSVGALCAELNIPVVVEGIENKKDHHLCKSLGFKFGQGYHFAYPDPPDRIRADVIPVEENLHAQVA